jgi:hypothetical protein
MNSVSRAGISPREEILGKKGQQTFCAEDWWKSTMDEVGDPKAITKWKHGARVPTVNNE